MDEECSVKPKPYPNVRPLFGMLISRRICTLHELRTIYSLEDAMYMYEALMVPEFNKWREMKAQESKAKAKR